MTNKIKWKQASLNLGLNGEFVENTYYSLSGVTERSDLNYLGLLVPYHDLNIYHPSICPLCIKENQFAHKLWDHKLITGCSKHKVELVSVCPSCGDDLVWNRVDLLTCQCEYDFNKAKLNTVDPVYVEYIEQLFQNMDQEKLNLLSSLYDDIRVLYQLSGTRVPPEKLTKLSVMSITDTNNLVNVICKLLIRIAKTRGVHPRLALAKFLSSGFDEIKYLSKLILRKLKIRYFHIEKSISVKNETVGLKEAASILGISMLLVKSIISKNILVAHRKTIKSKWNIDVKSLNDLLIKLSKGKKQKGDYVSLSKHLSNPKSIGDFSTIISQVDSGNMNYLRMDIEIGILSLEIEKHEQKSKYDSYLTIAKIAKLCCVNYENIRFAIHSGAILRIDPKLIKGTTIYVDKQIAHEFNKQYVFAGVLAKELKVNATNFTDKLIESGAQPVSGPHIDGGLTYLFKRSDINKLNLEKVAKLKEYKSKSGRRKKSDTITNDSSVSLAYIKEKLNLTNNQVLSLIKEELLIEVDDNLRSVSVTIESFENISKIMNDQSLITLKDASQCTNESLTQFLHRWIKSNFVEFIDISIERYISKKHLNKILNFKKYFVTSDEAGMITKTHRSHMNNLEKRGLIKIAKKFTSQHLTIKFYALEDVLQISKI